MAAVWVSLEEFAVLHSRPRATDMLLNLL